MLRMPLTWLRSRDLFGKPPAGLLFAWLLLGGSSALACTTAELRAASQGRGAIATLEADTAPETSGPAKMSPNQGLKLRTRHQDTVFRGHLPVAALPQPASPASRLAEADPSVSDQRTQVATPVQESASTHGYKPLAMLAAALVVMVSIALRRSGKR